VTRHRALVVLITLVTLVAGLVTPWSRPPALDAQGVEVFLNITGSGSKKLNIVIPEFTVVDGTDLNGLTRLLASVTGADLTFSGRFRVLAAAEGKIPANDPERLKRAWTDFAAIGAHAGLHGLLTVRGDRLEAEMRLYDLTSPDQRLITSKTFTLGATQPRRLAHKIADEVVLQFTGEAGVSDTRIAYVAGRVGFREVMVADYDGHNAMPVTRNGSINMRPVWSPDNRSLAFTSFMKGYPDLYRVFPFEKRPDETLAAFPGINSSPAFSADGRHVAMTLSKDGAPNIYVLTLATGTLRRLTRHRGIDTEPTWSPTGHQIAFVSDRAGRAHIFVMDPEGNNVKPLMSGGFHTQPRWSPKGDLIAYTTRAGNHDIWIARSDGSHPRRLTSGSRDNMSAAWSADGRHLMFHSTRFGAAQVFAMLADGTEQHPVTRGSTEITSPSWSTRLP
jgi:TolB protein